MSFELQLAPRVRAAQYLRMSTEHQRYSLDNQTAAIAEYAEARGYVITQTYKDAGKSGVSLRGRQGLRSLISDVMAGGVDFSTILVLDVSRWGRLLWRKAGRDRRERASCATSWPRGTPRRDGTAIPSEAAPVNP